MAKFRLTNKAVDDLSSIWNYTVEEWSESQADKYYEGLVRTFEKLVSSPFQLDK